MKQNGLARALRHTPGSPNAGNTLLCSIPTWTENLSSEDHPEFDQLDAWVILFSRESKNTIFHMDFV